MVEINDMKIDSIQPISVNGDFPLHVQCIEHSASA